MIGLLKRKNEAVRTVLIYRLGSLGDTVVALPSLRLIARTFPNAKRWILTNRPVAAKAAPLQQVVENSGLIHGYLDYRLQLRRPDSLFALRRSIRQLNPDVLVYLTPSPGATRAWRDYYFFKLCGIPRIVGVPLEKELRGSLELQKGTFWESEAGRLARCLRDLGDARIDDPASWDLGLTAAEKQEAESLLAGWPGRSRFLAASLGTKCPAKDWGREKWEALLGNISAGNSSMGLLLLGSADEETLSQQAASRWSGPILNLCGRVMPRVSAALMAKAVAFVGHDSGPMHLAAAVGTPCVAVFAARNLPGEWFPVGKQHRVIYHQTECFGCRLDLCVEQRKRCIESITINEVADTLKDVVERSLSALKTDAA